MLHSRLFVPFRLISVRRGKRGKCFWIRVEELHPRAVPWGAAARLLERCPRYPCRESDRLFVVRQDHSNALIGSQDEWGYHLRTCQGEIDEGRRRAVNEDVDVHDLDPFRPPRAFWVDVRIGRRIAGRDDVGLVVVRDDPDLAEIERRVGLDPVDEGRAPGGGREQPIEGDDFRAEPRDDIEGTQRLAICKCECGFEVTPCFDDGEVLVGYDQDDVRHRVSVYTRSATMPRGNRVQNHAGRSASGRYAAPLVTEMEDSMSTPPQPDVWLRGSIEGFDSSTMPLAQALLQAREDIEHLAADVPAEHVWSRPGGAASIGFHVRHLGGALDRLRTYARGESLSDQQKAAARAEQAPGEPPQALADVVRHTVVQIDQALDQLRTTSPGDLLVERKVGRAGLPSTALGLLFHAVEHSTRHAGQAITTAKILAGGEG